MSFGIKKKEKLVLKNTLSRDVALHSISVLYNILLSTFILHTLCASSVIQTYVLLF